ncbi:MAG: hypothetical protein HQK53_12400 [Oligoflexia bacterium]|nr:hypothetical protein [Oligoflexia bacterium]
MRKNLLKKMYPMVLRCLPLGLLWVLLLGVSSCAPTIYYVDRATVMETEAGGDWPDFEKGMLEKSEKIGATFLAPDRESIKEKRFNQILNGSFSETESKL